MSKAVKGLIIGGVLLVSTCIGGLACSEKIEPGYVGVVYNLNGGVEEQVLSQGFHLISPFKKVREYNVSIEQGFLSKDMSEGSDINDSFDIKTKDGSRLNIDLEYAYSFDSEKLPQTFTKFRGQDSLSIEQTFIRGKLKAYANVISRKYSLVELMGEKGGDYNTDLLEYVNNQMKEHGIIFNTVSATRVDPVDENIKRSISARMQKAQELEQAKLNQQKVQIEMATELEKQKKQAEITRVQADAKAYANEKLNQSISKELIELRKIEMLNGKWNGQLPKISGGNANILDISADVINQ